MMISLSAILSYLVYHALTPNIEHELFLAPASREWRKIDQSIFIASWLHVAQLGCGSSDGGTAALTPVASVHTSLWCDTAAEWQAVYQPVNTAANLSQPTINTRTRIGVIAGGNIDILHHTLYILPRSYFSFHLLMKILFQLHILGVRCLIDLSSQTQNLTIYWAWIMCAFDWLCLIGIGSIGAKSRENLVGLITSDFILQTTSPTFIKLWV